MMLTKLLFQFSFLKTFGNYEHVDVVPLQTHESGFLRILLESETYITVHGHNAVRPNSMSQNKYECRLMVSVHEQVDLP